MASVGYGFREVIIDEPFGGKWMDIDMNLEGGQGTFQGTKFSDRAGGFSYKSNISSPMHIMQNRFIYWRILNDTLELTELSMDYNLEDNQVRYIFRDSPIVSPITIIEDDELITLMVVTVTSVNRFTFTHPNKLFIQENFMKNHIPSIFHQVLNKPSMIMKSLNLYDHAINIPVPITSASYIMPNKSGYIFALSYESGSITICKITNEDTLICYDLKQTNIFTRLLYYTPSILRTPTNSPDTSIGMQFFIYNNNKKKMKKKQKNDMENYDLYLTTLSMNGHLRIYFCNNLQNINDWQLISDCIIDRRFTMDGYTDCNMILRSITIKKQIQIYTIYIPNNGFHIFTTILKKPTTTTTTTPIDKQQLDLISINQIDFKTNLFIQDFTFTSDHLYILLYNPNEDIDWQIKTYNLDEILNPRFNLVLLETIDLLDISIYPHILEPKEFYFNLIFNKCSFTTQTIYNALNTFETSSNATTAANDLSKYENDWEEIKMYTVSMIENEIRMDMMNTDEPLTDEEYYEIVNKYWLSFYNSCVEYHLNTIKPIGLFYEKSTQTICIIKKSRISFVRPTEIFETLYYFPHCIQLSSSTDIDERSGQLSILLKYFEIMDFIDSTTDEILKNKINKGLNENCKKIKTIFNEIANFLTETDPYSEILERRHFISILSNKLKELGQDGNTAMRLILNLFNSWSTYEFDIVMDIDDDDDEEKKNLTTEYYMASRYGVNLTYHILKQFFTHRFLILRNTMILQSIIITFFTSYCENDISIQPSLQDEKEAEEILIHCWGLLNLMEKNAEFIPDSLSEKTLKLSNIININKIDNIIQSKLIEFWPMKLYEMYFHSIIGGLAIRSRTNFNYKHFKIIKYTDAAARSIWPPYDSIDHPFEEFLISTCQSIALHHYTTNIQNQLPNGKSIKKFYYGIVDLFNGDFDLALGRFRSLSIQEIQDDIYFCNKILGWQNNNIILPSILIYQKLINIFQIFHNTYAIQILSDDSLQITNDNKWINIMSILGFKSSLILNDYKTAYKFIRKMPNELYQIGREKSSSIRTFICEILEKYDIEILLQLDINENFYKLTSTKDEIDKILNIQGKLSNPLLINGIYQMIYLYQLSCENYRKAASIMWERIIQIGIKCKGIEALRIQKDSYLDILTCLSLVEDKLLAFAVRNDEIDFISLINHIDDDDNDDDEVVVVIDGNIDKQRKKMKIPNDVDVVDVVVDGDDEINKIKQKQNKKNSLQICTIDEAKRECQLCISLLLLEDNFQLDPIKLNEGNIRAVETIKYLIQIYHFDEAIKLAKIWEINLINIINSFATIIINLYYEILPKNGDPADYIKFLDISNLSNNNGTIIDLAMNIMENYLKKLEKPMESYLHQIVTIEFLSYNITLPNWLINSYKKINCAQLLNCYLRYGEWEEATNLSITILDACLGRRDVNEFDKSIQIITPYLSDIIIPYTSIDQLANELKLRIDKIDGCQELYNILKEHCDDYVIRVNETRQERITMFS